MSPGDFQRSLMSHPKTRDLLIQASDLTPGSKAMQNVVDNLHDFMQANGEEVIANSRGAGMFPDAPTGYDVASKVTDNPYLGTALATVYDAASAFGPMVAGSIKGVKNPPGAKIADATEAFANRAKEPLSTETKIAQMNNQTGEVRDAMPDLVAREIYNRDGIGPKERIGLTKEALAEGIDTKKNVASVSPRSAYDNPKNAPPKVEDSLYPPGLSKEFNNLSSIQKVNIMADFEKAQHGGVDPGPWHDFANKAALTAKEPPPRSPRPPKTYFTPDKETPNLLEPRERFPGAPKEPLAPDAPMIEKFKARFSDDTKMLKKVDAAQSGPDHLPYIGTDGPFPFPNFNVKPTGKIGENRIQGYSAQAADPFSWTDDKWKVSKQLLQKHSESGIPAEINTSSDLIGRDDYIAAIPKGSTVNFHLTSPNEKMNKIMFPGNASRQRQDMAVDRLKAAGIKVNAIEPTMESLFEGSKKSYPGGKGLKFGEDWTMEDLKTELSRSGVLTDAEKAAGMLPFKPKGGE